MTLTQTPNRFQLRLDELHKLSIALYAEAISNPSDAVVEKIEAIAIEREEVHKAWEESWNNPAVAPATPGATAPAASASATKPHAPKKLMLSLVSVKRISSDVPACNFEPNELEIAGELSLAHGDFCSPPVLRLDGGNYKVISGHFQYHAACKRSWSTIAAYLLSLACVYNTVSVNTSQGIWLNFLLMSTDTRATPSL